MHSLYLLWGPSSDHLLPGSFSTRVAYFSGYFWRMTFFFSSWFGDCFHHSQSKSFDLCFFLFVNVHPIGSQIFLIQLQWVWYESESISDQVCYPFKWSRGLVSGLFCLCVKFQLIVLNQSVKSLFWRFLEFYNYLSWHLWQVLALFCLRHLRYTFFWAFSTVAKGTILFVNGQIETDWGFWTLGEYIYLWFSD